MSNIVYGWVLVFPSGEISPVYQDKATAEYAQQQHDPEPELVNALDLDPGDTTQQPGYTPPRNSVS